MLRIRRYAGPDRDAVMALHVAMTKAAGADTGEGPLGDDLSDVAGNYTAAGGDFLVGEENDRLVAVGAFRRSDAERAEIKRLRVQTERQGRGIGRAMLLALEARARSLSYRTLSLETSIVQQAAIGLCLRHGFRGTGAAVIDGQNCRLFEKDLLGRGAHQPLILPYRDRWPLISPGAFVAPAAVVAGDVTIGPGATVWFNCVLRGDVESIRVGANTNLQDGTIVHVTRKRHATAIGADVTIGHMAVIHGCTLDDGCFVGMNATVMDGCVVETGAMIAAGALLTPGTRAASGEVWAGRPARRFRQIKPDEQAMMAAIPQHYVELGREYRETLAGGDDAAATPPR